MKGYEVFGDNGQPYPASFTLFESPEMPVEWEGDHIVVTLANVHVRKFESGATPEPVNEVFNEGDVLGYVEVEYPEGGLRLRWLRVVGIDDTSVKCKLDEPNTASPQRVNPFAGRTETHFKWWTSKHAVAYVPISAVCR